MTNLTYSDVCPEVTKESIYYTIDERYPIKYYAIGEEMHQAFRPLRARTSPQLRAFILVLHSYD